jgi:ankyrin repeat protein
LRNNSLVRLRNHPELEIIHDDLGWTVTHDYISIGDAAYLPHQLQLDPQFVQLRDCWGATALHWAAYYANMEAISALLSAGADVNAVCKNGESVLFWASYSESVTCCRAIINAGADVELTNSIEENVLMSIVSNASPSEDIVELFLFSGITIESRDFDGSTALMRAVGYSSLPICVLLLDYGAEIDNRDSAGRSAVWDAILWNRHANLQLLIDRGASLTFLDIDGDSIIVQAALFADLDTTNILEEARIEGLPMNPSSVDHYWSWFNNNRDWYFTGQRPPLEDEKEAFQALLDSIIPCSDPPPPNTVETLDIPGAYPIEPTDELDSSTNSEFEESSDESETDN